MSTRLISLGRVALVFPGQGSQRPGMARDFCEQFAVARLVFDEASDALAIDMRALCFEDDARLNLTEFTQPAILTAEMAMWRALVTDFGLAAANYGGHSLGEYSALCAAGVIPLADAVRIVRRRGALMQEAVPVGAGAMSAVIASGIAARDFATDLAGLEVDVANRNSRDQVVLSGTAPAVAAAGERIRSSLATSASPEIVPLNVSAPFHSRLMAGIEEEFRGVLMDAAPRFRPEHAGAVTSNFLGGFHRPTLESLVDALTRQISGSVDWMGNMATLMAVADRILEIGPNRPLRGFFKAEGRDITSIISVKTAVALMTAEKERAA
ncbi:MAG: ACP S-malonyltransferase [Deltaproteobacteria bacterium]|nr:ACP S-malonyltransferase [Deltaproteobacteria bacterium]